MLKWTASAQKIMQESVINVASATSATHTHSTLRTPRQRRQRRATIANKENVPSYATSTPMATAATLRLRNSPLVLAPLTDIRNVTPETAMSPMMIAGNGRRQRIAVEHVYAATLPRFQVEEYSPSATLMNTRSTMNTSTRTTTTTATATTASLLPSGQHLALRGLLPLDPFDLGNRRYFSTPPKPRNVELPKKRKLEQEFAAIVAEEQQLQQQLQQKPTVISNSPEAATNHTNTPAVTCFSSAKMGDQTLDRLIDAILDSACKEEKKQKKSRKSFNLRRRTLLKNQQNDSSMQQQQMLSPSYAAGDDPASDLSFLLCESNVKGAPLLLLPTPEPATSQPGTPMPTSALRYINNDMNNITLSNTFTLETPVRPLAQKRRRCQQQRTSVTSSIISDATNTTNNTNVAIASPRKKFKVDASNYFEIGLALPSIYV